MSVINYIWKPAKNFRTGRRRALATIILHSTEGHKGGDLPTLIGGDGRQVSVHWYVTKDGGIYHFVQDADTAFHAGAVVAPKYSNDASIGIEQEHIDGQEPWPDLQLRTVANLVAFLKQKHGDLAITSHKVAAAPPGRKSDPEPYPWATFNAYVAAAMKLTWTAQTVKV